jgi:nucleoid-associated protein EbfC
MSKGFNGMPGNIQDLMKQAQKMQEKLMKAQEDAASVVREATSGGGMVRAVVNGKNRLVELKIEKDVVSPDDVEMLQDLIMAAVNEAQQKAQDALKEEMSKLTGGLNIPGLF